MAWPSRRVGSEPFIMAGLSLILQSALACVLVLLAVLWLHLTSLGLLRRFMPARAARLRALPESALPHVLVQLPVCDEGPLALRVAAAAARLDWPLDRLEIQLLDDGRAGAHQELCQAVKHVVS